MTTSSDKTSAADTSRLHKRDETSAADPSPAHKPDETGAADPSPARKRGNAKTAEDEPVPGSGEALYVAYHFAAGGKNHLNESLPAGFADLTEDRQAIWNATAVAITPPPLP